MHLCYILIVITSGVYSGRKITESLWNVTVIGEKYGKSKGERDG
jgi:hypothetical protein